jgi:hypothetical protein
VRRLLAWGAGFLGGAAAWKLLSRRPAPVHERDPADELRAKLAESRSIDDDRDEFVAGETPVDLDPAAKPPVRVSGPVEGVPGEPGGSPGADTEVTARRRRVHEQGRDALNEMRRSDA